MKGKTILTLVVVGSLMIVGAASPVAAHNGGTDVGASGHCSADGGSGGGGEVGVNQDGTYDATNPTEIQSVISALTFFGQQKMAHPDRADTCDGGESADGEDSYDYLEAHAGVNDQQVQFCYSEDNSKQNGGVGQGDQCHA